MDEDKLQQVRDRNSIWKYLAGALTIVLLVLIFSALPIGNSWAFPIGFLFLAIGVVTGYFMFRADKVELTVPNFVDYIRQLEGLPIDIDRIEADRIGNTFVIYDPKYSTTWKANVESDAKTGKEFFKYYGRVKKNLDDIRKELNQSELEFRRENALLESARTEKKITKRLFGDEEDE